MALEDFKLTELPTYNINWGMIPPEDTKKLISWTETNINNFVTTLRTSAYTKAQYTEFVKNFSRDLFESIHQIGYEEGSESESVSALGEGL